MEVLINEYNQLLLQEHNYKQTKKNFILGIFESMWNKPSIGNAIIEQYNICLEFNQIAIYIHKYTEKLADIIFTSVNFGDDPEFELIYTNGHDEYYYVKKELELSEDEKLKLGSIGNAFKLIELNEKSQHVIFNLKTLC